MGLLCLFSVRPEVKFANIFAAGRCCEGRSRASVRRVVAEDRSPARKASVRTLDGSPTVAPCCYRSRRFAWSLFPLVPVVLWPSVEDLSEEDVLRLILGLCVVLGIAHAVESPDYGAHRDGP